MNIFNKLFKFNSNINKNEKKKLIDNSDNCNNICISINNNNIKKNDYDIDFINYDKIEKHNFNLYLSENDIVVHENIKSTNYFFKTYNDYYIEFIKNIYLINNEGKLLISIKNNNIQIYSIRCNYKINNDYIYSNEIIKLDLKENISLYLYFKKNDYNKFYIYKIIYKFTE